MTITEWASNAISFRSRWPSDRRCVSRRRLFAEQLERRDLLTGVALTVNTLVDSLDADPFLSLREAIQLVNHQGDAQQALGRPLTLAEQAQIVGEIPFGIDDVIRFDVALFGEELSVLAIDSQLQIFESLRIEGPGSDRLAIDASESTEIAATPELEFDFTVVASDLSPTLRLFGSSNPQDAPFTVLRYGEGTVTALWDLPISADESAFYGNLSFTFGSNNPSAPVEVASLSFFDNGLSDGVAKQFYTPDGINDDPSVNLFIGGALFGTAEIVEINLQILPESPPITSSPQSNPSIMRLTSLFDDEFLSMWNELLEATGGTGILPFSLSTFEYDGQPIGFGDAARFDSQGRTHLEPLTGSRIFDIRGNSENPIDVDLTGLTLQGGRKLDLQSEQVLDDSNGGAIRSEFVNLTISESWIHGNRARHGGGIFSLSGSLDVWETIIEGNIAGLTSPGDGGGIYLDGSDARIAHSVVANNTSTYGGGIANYYFSQLLIENSTVFGNQAVWDGGGVDNFDGSLLWIVNSTIAENRAESGAGIWNGSESELIVVNGTIVANHGEVPSSGGSSIDAPGGGIYTSGSEFDPVPTVTLLYNTIVAGNTGRLGAGSVVAADLVGADVDLASAHNLIADFNTAGGLEHGVLGNFVGLLGDEGTLLLEWILDPVLGDYGGPTPTYRLVPDSPAIDAGDVTLAVSFDDPPQSLDFDQRGVGFPRALGANVDIGATEFGDNEITVTLDPATLLERIYGGDAGALQISGPGSESVSSISVSDPRFEVVQGRLQLKDDQWVVREVESEVSLAITLELVDQSLIEWDLTIEVLHNPTPWQNPWLAFDVDGDGSVTAFDALLVINFIGRDGFNPSLLGRDRLPDTAYYDVDGNGEVSAFDALLVINEIARRQSSPPPPEAEDGLGLLAGFSRATTPHATTPRPSLELLVDEALIGWPDAALF